MLIETSHILISLTVRLVGDPTPPFSYGRVEVLINGTWGTFCSDSFLWTLQNAHVICRQLRFDGAATASSSFFSNAFGVGTGSIWTNDLQCVGNETSISECRQNKWKSVRFCRYRATIAMCRQQGNSLICYDIFSLFCNIHLYVYPPAKFSCRPLTGPSFFRLLLLCFGCFSSNHITGKRYPEMNMDRTVYRYIIFSFSYFRFLSAHAYFD